MKKVITYEELKYLFTTFDKEAEKLRKCLEGIFEEMDSNVTADASSFQQRYNEDESTERSIHNKILINQRTEEEEQPEDTRLRFYKYHELKEYYYNRYRDPDFLKVERKSNLLSKEQYNMMSEDEKTAVYAGILKDLSIISARFANAFNRTKNSERGRHGGKYAYNEKNIHMANFLFRAKIYNELVSDTEQIAFGFFDDAEERINAKTNKRYINHSLVLNASLPGYTRLSLHFGNKTLKILRDANGLLKKMGIEGYPIEQSDIDRYNQKWKEYEANKEANEKAKKEFIPPTPNATIRRLAELFPYELPTYGILNLGLINCENHYGAEGYISQLLDKCLDENGDIKLEAIDEYISFMYPDFNDREVMYLAERAGFGKGALEKTVERLELRAKDRESCKTNDDLRCEFIKKRVSATNSKEELTKTLEELWDSHQIVQKTREEYYTIGALQKFQDMFRDASSEETRSICDEFIANKLNLIIREEGKDIDNNTSKKQEVV